MPIPSYRLRSALDRKGFSHATLTCIRSECRDALTRTLETRDACDHIMLYVIEDVCLRVAEWMDHAWPGGMTTEQHNEIEKTIVPSLEVAIDALGEPLSCDEKMASLSVLLNATEVLLRHSTTS